MIKPSYYTKLEKALSAPKHLKHNILLEAYSEK